MDMAALLEIEDSRQFRTLRRGEVVEGTIIAVNRDSLVVDIGTKSEGILPAGEMHSLGADPLQKVSVGEKVVAYVIQPETSEGDVLLSIDRARGERGWRVLQQLYDDSESFEAEVSGYNKGGLLVNVEGVAGFVPMSQLVGLKPDRNDETGSSLAQAVGKSLRLKVIELNRRRNRVILSERGALQEWRTQQKERLLAELQEGEIRPGRISSIRNFGIFVDLGGADGLVHLSEISWERARAPEELYKVGEEVQVYVMKVDPETKKIALSIRRAQPALWNSIVEKYAVNDIVPGIVTKLVAFGAYARIDGPIEGLIHISELSDRRISHPREAVREGDILPLRIVRIEADRHRIGLSLKQARERGEIMGFRFSSDGEVLSAPEEIREQFAEDLALLAPEGVASNGSGVAADDDEPVAVAPRAERADEAAAAPAPPPPAREQEEDDFPQTQMAAAFAAAKLDEALSDAASEDDES